MGAPMTAKGGKGKPTIGRSNATKKPRAKSRAYLDTCPTCRGSGQYHYRTCGLCRGKGKVYVHP
jgi:DnaJ-class molecular chaperone